ncbi:hypothetical protein MMC17_009988 [Xylographa soralifera]|nr:hypothetical protein [Xylographa soralifera]
MNPDITYITVLPGHSRPAFVRKPRNHREYPFGFTAIARALAPAPRRQRSYSARHVVQVRSPSPTYLRAYAPSPPVLHYRTSSTPTVVTQETVHTYPRSVQYSPPVLEQRVVSDSVTTKVITRNGRAEESTLQHTCSSCGKYRSASYQSRHPLAPGEIPKSGICRRCIRKHTSSEDSKEETRRLRRYYSYDKGHKRNRQQWRRYREDTDSTAIYPISPPSKEEIRVVRETRSISHDHNRSRSSSTDNTRIRVTIEPEHIRSRRRRSLEPVNIVERTRYVEQEERLRSRSRDSSLSDHERPVSVRVRRDEYGRTIRRRVVESYRPREVRTIEYGYDGNVARETSPVIRRSSASSLVQHTAFYPVEEKEMIESRERSYSPRKPVHRQDTEEPYASRSFNRLFRHRPTNSVRVLRMSQDTEDEIQTYSSERPALQRRVSFIEERSPLRSSTRTRLEEVEEPAIFRRRQEVRDTELESSDEASLRAFPSNARHYSAFQPRRDRLLPTGEREEEYELVRDFERTRIAPSRTYISPPAAIPHRMDHYHTSHHERSIGGSADEEFRRYYYVPDGAVFYRDV